MANYQKVGWFKTALQLRRYWSPRILLALSLLSLSIRTYLGDWSIYDLSVLVAILVVWPLLEWCIHVFMLHFKPRTLWGWRIDPKLPRSHREHHREPWEIEKVFVPLHIYLYLPLMIGFWLLVLPTLPLAMTGMTCYFALSFYYECVHYFTHTHYQPRSRYYKRIWKNHRLHHFKNESYWFGVTMLSGDRLLRTAPAKESVPTSKTCRTL